MRIFKLPGSDRFNDTIPHIRKNDNKPVKTPKKKTPKKKAKKGETEEEERETAEEEEDLIQPVIADDKVGIGGSEWRVYWPPDMEEWLRPVKRVVKPKDPVAKATPAKKGKVAAEAKEDATQLVANVQDQGGKQPLDPAAKGKKKVKAAAEHKPTPRSLRQKCKSKMAYSPLQLL